MKLIKSYFNKAIIINEMKRFYWVPLLYFFLLFISSPLQILIEIKAYYPNLEENIKSSTRFNNNLLGFSNPLIMLMTLIIPIVVALLIYRYLQSRSNSDMIHSLPIKRETLYISHAFVGALFLLVPIILTGFIITIINIVYGLDFIFTLEYLWIQIANVVIMQLVLYSITIFVGTVTGMTIPQGIITYIVLLLPIGMYQLLSYNIMLYVYGFNYEISPNYIYILSPLVKVLEISWDSLNIIEFIGYFLFVIVVLAIGIICYKKRKLENNLQVIVFKPLNYLFKYGVTFSLMLLSGMYFYRVTSGDMKWVWFGYLIFGFIGYALAEAIIKKTSRIFSIENFKGFLIYSIIIVILIVGLHIDIIGFENRIPDLENIESINMQNQYRYSTNILLEDEENIYNMRELHKSIIDNKDEIKKINLLSENPYESYKDFKFIYNLENGKTFTRVYSRVPCTFYQEHYSKVIESSEYKYNMYPILELEVADIQKISIRGRNRGYDGFESIIYLLEDDKIEELLEALKNDIKEASYNDLYFRESWGSFNFYLRDDENIFMDLNKSFEEAEKFLKSEGLLEDIRITENQIEYIVVEPFNLDEKGDIIVEPFNFHPEEESKKIKRYESSSGEEIEEALKVSYRGFRNGLLFDYRVGFYNDEGEQIALKNLRRGEVPSFIKEFYNEQ